MYNGVGVKTARGTGTSGYVVSNLSLLKKLKVVKHNSPADYGHSLDAGHGGALAHRKTADDILLHNRMRKVESRVIEYEDALALSGE